MVRSQGGHSDVVIAQDPIFNRLSHGVLEVRFILVSGRKPIQFLRLRHFGRQRMMRFIHKDGVKLDFLKTVDGIRHSYETFGIKVDLLVVARAHFAEAGEVGSELMQQGSQGNRDQNLRMARNGTLIVPLETRSLVSGRFVSKENDRPRHRLAITKHDQEWQRTTISTMSKQIKYRQKKHKVLV